jgi:hypothetical protein
VSRHKANIKNLLQFREGVKWSETPGGFLPNPKLPEFICGYRLVSVECLLGLNAFVGSLVWRPRRNLTVQEGGWFMTRIEPSKPDYERVPMSLPHSRGISPRLNPSDSPIASLYKFKYNSYGEEERGAKTNWFGFYHVRTRCATWSDNRAIIQLLSGA